jgi:hypothetical protein
MMHEERATLSKGMLDTKRAIDSLCEELEAIDFYQQRAEACTDEDLRKILKHNMREEQEHAAMLIAWLKNGDAYLDEMLKKFLPRASAEIAKE